MLIVEFIVLEINLLCKILFSFAHICKTQGSVKNVFSIICRSIIYNYEKERKLWKERQWYSHIEFSLQKNWPENLLKNISLKYNVTILNFLSNFAIDDRGSSRKIKEIKIFIESPKTRYRLYMHNFLLQFSSYFGIRSNVDRDCIANINQFSDIAIFAVWLTQIRSPGSEPTRATFTSSMQCEERDQLLRNPPAIGYQRDQADCPAARPHKLLSHYFECFGLG